MDKSLQHAPVEHAEGQAHKVAYDLFLKTIKGMTARERTEQLQTLLHDNQQASLLAGLDVMRMKDFDLTKKNFETAYFIVKEEISLTKYAKILELEQKHGVDLGCAYRNKNTCGLFIDFIADDLAKQLKEKLDKRHFYSVLTDGSTDSGIIEKGAIFVMSFNPTPPVQTE